MKDMEIIMSTVRKALFLLAYLAADTTVCQWSSLQHSGHPLHSRGGQSNGKYSLTCFVLSPEQTDLQLQCHQGH